MVACTVLIIFSTLVFLTQLNLNQACHANFCGSRKIKRQLIFILSGNTGTTFMSSHSINQRVNISRRKDYWITTVILWEPLLFSLSLTSHTVTLGDIVIQTNIYTVCCHAAIRKVINNNNP